MRRCETSFSNSGLVYIYGDIIHSTRPFIRLAEKYIVYVISEESDTSVLLYVAELLVSPFLKHKYKRDYSAAMCTGSTTCRVFDDIQQIAYVVRALQALWSECKLITACFGKCWLLADKNDVYRHSTYAYFNNGAYLRDPNLPQVIGEHENLFYLYQACLVLYMDSSLLLSPLYVKTSALSKITWKFVTDLDGSISHLAKT